MIDIKDLLLHVVRPVLHDLKLHSEAAEQLVIGTALVESGLRKLDQYVGGNDTVLGPAIGLWQMETATHDDIWENFLTYRPELRNLLARWHFSSMPRARQMAGNLYYAAAMCRLQYFRSRHPLPAAFDWPAMAAYWKLVYNTPLGKGDPKKFVQLVKEHLA